MGDCTCDALCPLLAKLLWDVVQGWDSALVDVIHVGKRRRLSLGSATIVVVGVVACLGAHGFDIRSGPSDGSATGMVPAVPIVH